MHVKFKKALLRGARVAALVLPVLMSAGAYADDSLYRTFGEKPGLVKITDDLYTNLLADPRTAPYFENAPIRRIKEKLVEQFCVLLGGPCQYTGRTMKRTTKARTSTARRSMRWSRTCRRQWTRTASRFTRKTSCWRSSHPCTGTFRIANK